jgi:hypothetical protein
MQNKHKLAIALGFVAVLGTVEGTQAAMKFFAGTRSQVRAACTGPNRFIHEGSGMLGIPYTLCIDTSTNIGVSCDDGGGCIATGESLRVASPKTPPRKPRGSDYQVPTSLSEPVSGGAAVTYDPPAPEPQTDTGVIN